MTSPPAHRHVNFKRTIRRRVVFFYTECLRRTRVFLTVMGGTFMSFVQRGHGLVTVNRNRSNFRVAQVRGEARQVIQNVRGSRAHFINRCLLSVDDLRLR